MWRAQGDCNLCKIYTRVRDVRHSFLYCSVYLCSSSNLLTSTKNPRILLSNAAFILGFQNAAVHITFRPATSRAVRSISRGSSPQSGTDLFRLRMNRADGTNVGFNTQKIDW